MIILNGLNIPLTSLLSILIARYYSIKRLVLENLSSSNSDHLFTSIGIISDSFIYSLSVSKLVCVSIDNNSGNSFKELSEK